MADAPPDLVDAYEHRCRAIECLAALDRPTLAEVWRSGYPPLIEDLGVRLYEILALARYSVIVAGVEPKALLRSGDGAHTSGKRP